MTSSAFPAGKEGAHQIINRTDSPVRVLMLSSMIRGEIIEYLDTGKILAKDAADEDIMFARPGPTAEYWEGEDYAPDDERLCNHARGLSSVRAFGMIPED